MLRFSLPPHNTDRFLRIKIPFYSDLLTNHLLKKAHNKSVFPLKFELPRAQYLLITAILQLTFPHYTSCPHFSRNWTIEIRPPQNFLHISHASPCKNSSDVSCILSLMNGFYIFFTNGRILIQQRSI